MRSRINCHYFIAPFLVICTLLELLSGCEARTEGILADRLEVETLVNPAVANLTTGTEVRAWLIGDSAVIGFGGDYAFYTPNDFDSLFAVSDNAELKTGKLLFNDFENLVIQTSTPSNDLVIEQASNYGSEYSVKVSKDNFEERDEGGINIQGTHQFEAAAFAGIDVGWVFSNYTAISGQEIFDNGIKVYSVIKNGFTGLTEISLISELSAEYVPVEAAFFNALSGWLLTRKGNQNYLFITGDGGYSWQGPYDVGNANGELMTQIANYDPQNLYLYSPNHTAIYASHDGGITWLRTEPTLANLSHQGVTDLYVVSAQVAYTVLSSTQDDIALIGSVFRTNNGGASWEKANAKPLYAEYIDCLNEETCIATSRNVVQISRDGGITWKVLVYPL